MMSKYGSGNGNNSRKKDHHELLLKATSRSLFLHNPTPKFLFSSSKDRTKSAGSINFSESDNDSTSIVSENVSSKGKKSSSRLKWKKPLKALSHIGQQRFNCSFFLHVRSIEGLPSSFNGISLCVHWKRKDKVLQTCSTRVIQGTADFDETLMQRCSVYVARSGQHWAKYREKLSLVYVSVVGAPGIDIGKHGIDLTRLLPITLEELTGEKSSGKWTTNLGLGGRAEGAFLNVTFSFAALRENMTLPYDGVGFSQPRHLTEKGSGIFQRVEALNAKNSYSTLRRADSTPSSSTRSPFCSWSNELNSNWEVMQSPDLLLSYPTDSLYRKLKEGKVAEPDNFSEPDVQKQREEFDSPYVNEFDGEKFEQIKFTVTEKGIELSKEEHHKANPEEDQIRDGPTSEFLEVGEISIYDDIINDEEANCKWKNVICSDCENKNVSECKKENNDTINDEEANCNWKDVICGDLEYKDVSGCKEDKTDDYIEESEIKEMKYNHNSMLKLECAESKSPTDTSQFFGQDNYGETKLPQIGKNCAGFWEVDENAFFSSSEHDPESPRERLLREFEKEALASGSFILDLYAGREAEEFTSSCRNDPCSEDISEGATANLSAVQGADKNERSSQLVGDRINLADGIESGEPMKAVSFNEKVSKSSTNFCSTGTGSSTKPPESLMQPPQSTDCVGPVIWSKDGCILCTMYPKLLNNVQNDTPLAVQVSRPIVLPAEMGSRVMDVLQCLASVDIEKLSTRLESLLPLEDISGKSVQEIANRAAIAAPVREHQAKLQNESEDYIAQSHGRINSNSTVINEDQEIVLSLDIASLLAKRTEFLLIEGLKIQSGMSDDDAPARIDLQLSKKAFPSRGRTAIFGRSDQPEGIAGLELLIADTDDGCELDDLFGMSLTIDEWLTSRAGEIDNDDNQITKHTSELLAVQSVECKENSGGRKKRDTHWGSVRDSNHNFTIAVRVQLRDPSQNFEALGIPMLAFVQVKMSAVCVMPNVSCIVTEPSSNTEKSLEEIVEKVMKEDNVKELPSGFKVIGINVAGLRTPDCKKQFWGTAIQQQSGAQWLLASGMKELADKYEQLVECRPIVRGSSEAMVQHQDILWSISSQNGSRESSVKELSMTNSHVRNPDIILPEAGIRVHAAGFF